MVTWIMLGAMGLFLVLFTTKAVRIVKELKSDGNQ